MSSSWNRAYTRRQALGVGAAGVGALYLAACGGDASSSSSGRNVAVTYDFEYVGKPGSMKRYWEALRDALAESDVDARLTDLSLVNYANMQARLQTAHAAKKGSTMETWYPDWYTYQFISQGALSPVEDYVDKDGIDDWLLATPIDGKYWGAPYVIEQALLVANRRHLEKAGVEVGDRFESWDAFIDACKKLKRSGEVPVMVGASDGFASDKWSLAMSMPTMDSLKTLGEFSLGEVSVDEPVVSEWIDGFRQLYVDGYCNADAAKITDQQAVERFIDGEGGIAMLNPGPLFAQNPDEFRIVGYWKGPGKYSAPIAAAGSYALITSYGENKEAAGRVIDFMQEPAQLKLFNEITGEMPSNRRFDTGDLGELQRASWELLTGDPAPTWARNFTPTEQVNAIFDIGTRAFAGDNADVLRGEYAQRMEKWRDQNSAEAKEFKTFLDKAEVTA